MGSLHRYRPRCRRGPQLIARYYDPTTGQFLTVDPDVAKTLSPYGYVEGDPLNGADATGLCQWWQLGCWFNQLAYGTQNPILIARMHSPDLGQEAQNLLTVVALINMEDGEGEAQLAGEELIDQVGTKAADQAAERVTVQDILSTKVARITRCALPKGSPGWDQIRGMTMQEVIAGAKANRPGYKTLLKLLTDSSYNR